MKKIIFLDVDGVLNCRTDFNGSTYYVLDPKKIKRLHRIIRKTNAEIVLSSTWRKFPKMLEFLKKHDVNYIDVTIDLNMPSARIGLRGAEIEHWINNNSVIEKYVIIDDEDDFLPFQKEFFVKTEWLDWNKKPGGLQAKHVKKAIEILNGEKNAKV